MVGWCVSLVDVSSLQAWLVVSNMLRHFPCDFAFVQRISISTVPRNVRGVGTSYEAIGPADILYSIYPVFYPLLTRSGTKCARLLFVVEEQAWISSAGRVGWSRRFRFR